MALTVRVKTPSSLVKDFDAALRNSEREAEHALTEHTRVCVAIGKTFEGPVAYYDSEDEQLIESLMAPEPTPSLVGQIADLETEVYALRAQQSTIVRILQMTRTELRRERVKRKKHEDYVEAALATVLSEREKEKEKEMSV